MVWMISTLDDPMESFHQLMNSCRRMSPVISLSISTKSSLSSASVIVTPSREMATASSSAVSAPLPSTSNSSKTAPSMSSVSFCGDKPFWCPIAARTRAVSRRSVKISCAPCAAPCTAAFRPCLAHRTGVSMPCILCAHLS